VRVEQFLAKLEGVTGSAPQWHARCPAHDDRQASLTIGLGADDRILATCWAGCELDAICRAVGVSVRDLFPSTDDRALGHSTPPWGPRPLGEAGMPLNGDLERAGERLLRSPDAVAYIKERKGWDASTLAALDVGLIGDRFAIPVKDLNGKLVNLLRYKPDGRPKMIAMRGRPRTPLYLLHDDGPLFIVEGETDAVSAAVLGIAAIGAPGASTKPNPEWFEPVRDRDVIVCMDNDKAGRKAAWRWANLALNRGAASVKVLTLEGPEKFDLGDWVLAAGPDRGAARRALLELVAEAEPFDPERLPPEHAPDPPEIQQAEPAGEPSTNGAAVEPGTIILHPLSGFSMRRLRMLWADRIPVGRVGIIFGPPGQGKSTLLALIMGDVVRAGGRVMIASAEDDPETTLRPRLTAAGADLARVDLMATAAAKGETGLVLPRDLDALHARMRERDLVVIDPLSAHLGEEVNSWSEHSVRALVLAPLALFSRLTDCTVVLIMHINKSNGTDPLARISGSGGFGGAARFALLLGAHPDDLALDEADQRLALVHVKASETIKRRAMVFRRQPRYFELGDSEVVETSTLELLDDDARISPEAVLQATDPDEAGSYSQALTFLRHELGDGPKLAKKLLATARERGDFSERTLRKAKNALGVNSEKDTEGWWWRWEAAHR
jgi:putative DNA primase/helicase